MLPAQRGDALWITYGRLEARIAAIPGKADRVELLVVTHVDADHIQGIVSLLSDPARVPLFRDVWFNGWKHLQPEVLGGLDAERMTAPLLQHEDRWNAAFEGHAVVVPDDGPLPVIELADGMRLTLLSPTRAALTALVPEWEAACKAAGVLPGEGAPIVRKGWIRDEVLGGFDPDLLAQSRFSADPSKPNGSGIAFVAEYDGKRALFLADCPPGPVLRALDRLGVHAGGAGADVADLDRRRRVRASGSGVARAHHRGAGEAARARLQLRHRPYRRGHRRRGRALPGAPPEEGRGRLPDRTRREGLVAGRAAPLSTLEG